MKELNKWVDIRKKQTREVTDMDVIIVKDESLIGTVLLFRKAENCCTYQEPERE